MLLRLLFRPSASHIHPTSSAQAPRPFLYDHFSFSTIEHLLSLSLEPSLVVPHKPVGTIWHQGPGAQLDGIACIAGAVVYDIAESE
jgi:hypothetical protein